MKQKVLVPFGGQRVLFVRQRSKVVLSRQECDL